MVKVIYCIWCFQENFDEAKECIERVQPGVDEVCVVGNDLTEEQVKWLKDKGCHVKVQPFNDNFPSQRNAYLDMARKLDPEPWVLVSDPDELFNEEFVRDLKKIIPTLEAKGYNTAGINCLEKFKEAELIDEVNLKMHHQIYTEGRESNYFKLLLFKVYSDTAYGGIGQMPVTHETWGSPTHPPRAVYLPKRYQYEHKKSAFKMWENSARNVFLAGGGNSVGSINSAWTELRQTCGNLGINTWDKFRNYIRKGNIDKALLDWILNNMVNNGLDYVAETTQISKWYFGLHPDEWIKLGRPKVKYQPSEEAKARDIVFRAFFDVLGRHPDIGAVKSYSEAILKGDITPEQLPNILRQSQEYKDKFSLISKPAEHVRMPVPVNVDVRVTEDTFARALMKSQTYWEKIKPRLDFASKWEAYLAISFRAETGGKGADIEPLETYSHYIKKIKEAMPPDKYNNILDVGAGAGDETKALIDAGYKVIGITLGRDNIKHGKEQYGINLLEMDMHNLHFPEGFFDGAIVIHTFEHCFAPLMFLGELYYVLRDGARVFVAVPDPKDKKAQTIWHSNLLYEEQIRYYWNYWGFKEITSKEICSRGGWDRYQFLFEKLPKGHSEFEMWSYLQHVYKRRRRRNEGYCVG